MSLIGAMENLATICAGMSGMAGASHEPPADLTTFPYCVVYLGTGKFGLESGGYGGFSRGFSHLIVEILQGRINPYSIATSSVWPERLFPLLTADQTLGSEVEHIVWPMTFEAINIEYSAGEIYAAMRISIQVKSIL